jgi:NTE family protein
MPVALACRISASIPYFYEAVLYCGCYYIDGGCLDNYPIGVFSNDKTIGLKLISDSDVDVPKFESVDNILEFTSRIAMCVHAQALRVHVHADDFAKTVKINCGNVSFINFNLSAMDKQKLIDCGALAMQKFRDDSAMHIETTVNPLYNGKIV